MLAGALVGFAASGRTAQIPAEPEPLRNVITFTLHVAGEGSDPRVAPTVEDPVQDWKYERTIDGWFEVEVAHRTAGTGPGARELVEFTRKRGGRHQIIGIVSDWAKNFERRMGVDAAAGNHADYTASESADWCGAVEPPESLLLTLDATKQTWVEMFEPQPWMGNYRWKMDFRAEAKFEPSAPGTFGRPWTFLADDPSQRSAGEGKQINVRYYPGDRDYVASLPGSVKHDVPAKFDEDAITGRVEFDVPRPDGAVGTWKKMHYTLDWSARTDVAEVRALLHLTSTWKTPLVREPFISDLDIVFPAMDAAIEPSTFPMPVNRRRSAHFDSFRSSRVHSNS